MKLWSPHSSAPAGLGQANTLDLVSAPDRLAQARDAELAVVAVMRNEMFMLKHFLNHYRALGVGAFLVADNGSDDGTLEELAAQPDVVVFSTDTPYNESRYGVLVARGACWRRSAWAAGALWPMRMNSCSGRCPTNAGRCRAICQPCCVARTTATPNLCACPCWNLYPSGPLAQAGFAHGPFADATHIDRAPLRCVPGMRGPWGNLWTVSPLTCATA